jgi:hypothetical protein
MHTKPWNRTKPTGRWWSGSDLRRDKEAIFTTETAVKTEPQMYADNKGFDRAH